MSTKGNFWKWSYTRWDKPIDKPIPGYTTLLPVPGDLPVFTRIALEVCSTQNLEHLVETLVIPDKLVPGFPELVKQWDSGFAIGSVRLLKPSPLEQLIVRFQNNPHTNHWLQLIRGANAVQTTHVLLHDADLFITEPNFMETHYETCVERHLACLGVNPVWDTWYQEQGINHLTATWEMIFDVSWLRSFKPWEHRGHDGFVNGKPHTFDTTLWPQCQTQPDQIARHQQEWGFIHFNYVICTYRWFQQRKGSFEDENFRILLIRLLIDAYDQSGWHYDVPSLDELIKGIKDKSNCVTYLQEQTRQQYAEFRSKLQQLIDSGLLDDQKALVLSNEVSRFDRALG